MVNSGFTPCIESSLVLVSRNPLYNRSMIRKPYAESRQGIKPRKALSGTNNYGSCDPDNGTSRCATDRALQIQASAHTEFTSYY